MRVAVVGAGFSGLALSYHLLNLDPTIKLTLYEVSGVGAGASGIASGLMHPYPGEHSKYSFRGREAMLSSLELLKCVEDYIGSKVSLRDGILKVASPKQEEYFRNLPELCSDVELWEVEKVSEYLGVETDAIGLFIRSGVTVHSASYLVGLAQLIEHMGGQFERKKVSSIDQLEGFDAIALTIGGSIGDFVDLPLKWIKGQILICKRPLRLKGSAIGSGYIALSENQERCFVGSSYEHEYANLDSDLEVAKKLILPRIERFFPHPLEILSCSSSVRVSSKKSYHPIVGRYKNNVWVMTAMGSRGLLYHSDLGNCLARAILKNEESHIYPEVRL